MTQTHLDPFGARALLAGSPEPTTYYRLDALAEAGVGHVSRLPFSIKVLLEALLRQVDGFAVTEEDVVRLANWDAAHPAQVELPFKPARVIMQDFTGVPGVVDLAAMRSAMARAGGDPKRVNPLIPVDLVIDHSVQVDDFGSNAALLFNAEREFERNRERYEFLKWGQQAFDNFRVVPPATGIVHQVNLEYLAKVVQTRQESVSRGQESGRRPRRLPRHRGRHRQPHDHDQRPGRAGLGRGRHRGRGGDVGPADLHADAPGHRLQADRRAAARRHRHGSRAHGDADVCGRRGWWTSSSSSSAPVSAS